MELSERIRFMRMFKKWSQDEMAAKLHMAVSGYAKIERGETDISFSRLEQIAKTFEIELISLIGMNEKSVFNLIDSPNACNYNNPTNTHHAHANTHSTVNVYSCEAVKFQHENEKLLLVLEQKDKQIDSLQQQVSDLREIISLLKNTDPS